MTIQIDFHRFTYKQILSLAVYFSTISIEISATDAVERLIAFIDSPCAIHILITASCTFLGNLYG